MRALTMHIKHKTLWHFNADAATHCLVNHNLRFQPLIALLWLVILSFSVTAHAREWYIQPTVKMQFEADDNILLRSDEKNDVFGFKASFAAISGTRTATSDIDLKTLVDVYHYWGQDNLDRVNVGLYGHSDFQITARNAIGLDADYVRDNTVTSELDTTGLTQNPIPRELFNVAPHWSYALSELQSLQVQYKHEEVRYDNDANTSLTSYITDSINLSFQHQWQENLQYFITYSSLWYRVTDFDREVNNHSVTTGMDYRYSETLSFNFMVGARFSGNSTTFAGITITDDSIGALFGLGFNKQFEQGYFNFDYSRSITPSSIGKLLQVDSIKFASGYDLTRNLGLSLTAAINKTNSANDSERIYYSVEPKLIWRFNRQLNLSGSYRFRLQEYDSIDSRAVSNGFFVAINYQWDDFTNNRF
ncbi:MAG: polysaccharide biosynthesis protein VpsM [Methyloprofundus sp.]|nr:MAG: polysaccharide biosynthesis protein VpsM [Methyloprofundus sp.]